MKFNQPINIQVCSRRIMLRPAKFLEFLRFYETSLPKLKPSFFSWTDPVNKPWDLSNYENYLPPDRFGDADSIFWNRRKNPKAEGYFKVGRKRREGVCDEWHSGVSFRADLNGLDVPSLVEYIKNCSIHFDGDISQVHWVTLHEKALRAAEYHFDMAGANGGSEVGTSALRHWLPALPWAVVFGDAYVRMFGMERLLSAPAFEVERLSDSAVYIQLTPDLSDLETDYASFHAARLQVQAHLGNEAFFDVARAYPLRGPVEDMPMIEFVKAMAEFRCPSPGTNGFKVPDFQFIE